MRPKIVRIVVLASFVCALLPCVLWAVATYSELRRNFDEAAPLAVGWSAERVRARLEAAREEIEQIGLAQASDGKISKEDLAEALSATETFSALLLLDREGKLIGLVGSGPELASLLAMLDARNALETELVTVMRGSQLRKQMGNIEAVAIRVIDAPDQPPFPVAGTPLRDRGGETVAALHGLVARDAIAGALRKELLGVHAHLFVSDANGQVVASNDLGCGIDHARAGAANDFFASLLKVVGPGWRLRYEAPIDFVDWTVATEGAVLEALRPLARTLAAALFLPPALALVFGSLALWSATRMARPLWSLYANMRQVAREEALEEVALGRASGETESLIEAFNALVRRLYEDKVEAERSRNALREQNQAFQQQHENLSKLTVTDSLTQLANRRYFEDQLKLEIKRISRHGQGLALLMIDVDDFKLLNDTLGHAAGDQFLKQIGRILKETLRETDLAARYGGEEFVVVATGTSLQGAVVLAEKIRTAVAEASFIVDSSMRPRRVTISVGVAEYRGSQTDLFNSADAALYQAKSAGKNCVFAANSDRDGGSQ